ncbi:MAG: hypothetical protein WBR18_11000 [Anaerolineales bacterium]
MGKSSDLAVIFAAELDARLGLLTSEEPERDAPSRMAEVVEDVEFALSLWPAEFPEESEAKKDVHDRLRMRLPSTASNTTEFQDLRRRVLEVLRPLTASQWRLAQAAIAAALVLILLQVFQVPVWASLQRLVGYGYAPKAGFVPLEGTMILPRPIDLDVEGGGVEIEQIVLTRSTLELWIVSDAENPPPDIAEINLPLGEVTVLQDAYRPETSRGKFYSYWRFRGEFVSPSWIELRLEGFQARRIPLQSAVELLASLTTFRTCDSHNGISVCAVALTFEPESTCALVEIRLQDNELNKGFPRLREDPVVPRRVISILTSKGGRSTGTPQGFPSVPLEVSTESGTFLEQLCFPVPAPEGELILEVPAVEVTVPIMSRLRVPIVSEEEGWVDLGESFEWAGAEIAFEQVRAFTAGSDTTILRVLGKQIASEEPPIITTFQLDVRGESGVSLSGTNHEPRDPHDARTGLHFIDLWLTPERVGAIPNYIVVTIGHAQLTYVGPFELRLIK